MERSEHTSVADARTLRRVLRELGQTKAPVGLLRSVLEQVTGADLYSRLDTPVGPLFVAYNQTGISAVERATSETAFEQRFRDRFGRPIRQVVHPPALLARSIRDHLAGEGATALRFDLRAASPFERAVLLKALEIPRGEVRPYAWIAREIGRPKAVRAVGTALAGNPVPLLIPCHRVVRTDGRIGNYVFGSETKRAVLDAEGAAPEVIESLARTGVRYYGFRSSGNYCLPTCGGEHLRDDRERLAFRSEQAAIAAGLHPCNICRPV
ncbi:MAG: Methylated-DNA--protein-cysteine methyltransferase [uncultured Chloroflexia bacterium]|uniref:methylated-DNA--[protein]-cysteine S-methyltransferase n=1 Tax=uncultured Chloroflexia bacterium TaxID=1672391 RepID=A0A6J4I1G7_9CHLR|nr:MAG: Methylated-DNA--protein-cysteine methyltransferase [uncultured Chloroflexia bacterium]